MTKKQCARVWFIIAVIATVVGLVTILAATSGYVIRHYR